MIFRTAVWAALTERFNNLSLAWKFRAVGVITTAVALAIACAVLLIVDLSTERERLVRDLTEQAEGTAIHSVAALTFRDAAAARETLGAMRVNAHIVKAAVLLPSGETFARFDRDPSVARALNVDASIVKRLRPWSTLEQGSLRLIRPVAFEGETLGVIYVESDLDEMNARVRHYLYTLGLALLGALTIALALVTKFERIIAAPLIRLTDSMRVVTREHRYDLRVAAADNDEIGELIAGFNEMLGEIQDRDRRIIAAPTGAGTDGRDARTAELRVDEHRSHPRARQGDGGQPRQERIPGQHEPRDPHADERHHRHDRARARHRPDRAAARLPRRR